MDGMLVVWEGGGALGLRKMVLVWIERQDRNGCWVSCRRTGKGIKCEAVQVLSCKGK